MSYHPRVRSAWPDPPVVEEATPARPRRAWAKVPHEQRYKQQRRDLLRAAAKLASRNGYHATRLADIVAEAGLSKSTFYEHFASKEECFVELYRRVSAALLRTGVQAAEDTLPQGPYETVLAVIRAVTGYVAQNRRLADVLREEIAASHPAIAQERAETHRRMAELLVVVARKVGSPLDDDELRVSMSVLVQGMTAVLPQLSRKGELETHLEPIAGLACRAIGVSAGQR